MAKGNLNEEMVECHHTNGTITMVPAHVFAKIVMEMENMPPGKYVTYKEGALLWLRWGGRNPGIQRITKFRFVLHKMSTES